MRKAIDQFAGARVAKFAANQALQKSVVRLQAARTIGELAVSCDKAIAVGLEQGPMGAQRGEVAGAEGRHQSAAEEQHQKGTEGEVEPDAAEIDAHLCHRNDRKAWTIRNSRALMTEQHSKMGKRPIHQMKFEFKISL